MNLLVDVTILFILMIASTAIAFFYNRNPRDYTAVGFLALGLATFNLVYVLRLTGVQFGQTGATNAEDVLFLLTAVFLCIFVILHFLRKEEVSRYGQTV